MLSKSDWRDTNERESNRYYVGTISRVCTHKQKAGLQSCCSASRGSGIAFSPKQQHWSPRRMYKCAHYARTLITYQWASCAAMFWIICEFTRFLLAKTKRVRRLLSRSPNSSQFAIPPMAKSQVRQLSPLSPCETSPCFFWDPIKRSLRGADTNAFMSCIHPHPKDIYPRRGPNTAKLS